MATISLGELLLRLQVDETRASNSLRRFINNLGNVNNSVRNFGSRAQNASGLSSIFNSTLSKMVGFFTALKVIDTAVNSFGYFVDKLKEGIERGIEYNSTIEYTQAAIGALVGNQEKANKLTEQMVKLAAETPFATENYSQAAKTLLGYGVASDDVMGTMEMLGNVSMGNSYAFDRLALAFGQVTAKGKLQAEEVRQMVNQGFNPLKFIAERTGETMGELTARMKKGEVTSEEVTQAFKDATTGTGRFANTMDALSKTYKGQKEKIKEYGDIFWGKVTKPLYDFLAAAVFPTILKGVQSLTGGVEGFYASMGKVVNKIVDFIKAFLSGDYDKIHEVLLSLVPDSLKDSVMDITIIVAKFRKGLKWLKDRAIDVFDYLSDKVGKVANYFKDKFEEKAIPVIKKLIKSISNIDPQPFLDAFESMKNLFKDVEPYLKKFTKFMIDMFIDKIVGMGENAKGFTDNIGKFIEKIKDVGGKIQDFLQPIIDMLIESFKNLDIEGISEAWDNMKKSLDPLIKLIGVLFVINLGILIGIFNGLVAAVDNVIIIFMNVIGIIGDIAGMIVGFFTGDWQMVHESILSMADKVIDIFDNLIQTVIDFCAGLFDVVTTWFKNLYETLVGGSIVPDIVNGIIDWFKKLPGKLLGFVKNIYTGVKNGFNNMKTTVIDKVKGMYNSVINKFNSMKSSVVNKVNSTKTSVINKFNSMKSSVVNKVNSIKTSVINKFNSMKSSVVNKVNSIKTSATGKFNSIKSSVKNAVSNMVSSVKDKINSMKNAINDKIKTVKDKFNGMKTTIKSAVKIDLYSAGRNILGTFISGIKSKISNLSSSLKGAASKIKSYLGFSSPTKEGPGKTADKWMPNLMNMMIEGIEKHKEKLAQTVSSISSTIQASVAIPELAVPTIAATEGMTTIDNKQFNITIYADNRTNGRSVGKDLITELNNAGILTHKGGI